MTNFNQNVEYYYDCFLTETPMFADSTYLGDLNILSHNYAELQNIIKNCQIVGRFKEYDIYQYHDKISNKTRDFFTTDKQIHALIAYTLYKDVLYSFGIWQLKDNKGLMQDIFLNYIPTIANSVVSDSVSNTFGKQFWFKLINIALNLKLKTTVIYKRKTETDIDINNFNSYYQKSVLGADYVFKIYFK